MEQEKSFLIKQSEVQKLLDYLVKRPYIEVHQLIQFFLNLKEGIEKDEQKEQNKRR